MGVGMSRFPDPYQTRDDVGHAAIFLVALLLLLVVGAVLFFGNAWVFSASDLPGQGTINAVTSLTGRPTPVAPPTFAAPTAAPPLAGVAYKPTPNGSPTAAASPTPAGSPTAAPSSTRGPAPTPAPKPSPAPSPGNVHAAVSPVPAAPTTSPVPSATANATAKVGNTGGDGVYLRHTPNLNDKWVAWPDNTPLTLTGAQANADGVQWVQVRDPRGDVGWIPTQFVVH